MVVSSGQIELNTVWSGWRTSAGATGVWLREDADLPSAAYCKVDRNRVAPGVRDEQVRARQERGAAITASRSGVLGQRDRP
jgi:hypothetical protein